MIKKINYKLFIYSPLILIIFTIFNIKKIGLILTTIILCCIFIEMIINKKVKYMNEILLLVFVFIIQIVNHKINLNKEFLNYFLSFCAIILYFNKRSNLEYVIKNIEKDINKVYYIYISIFIIILFSCLLSRGWMRLWGGKQFISFFGYPHDAAYYLIGIESAFICIYYYSNDIYKKYISIIIVIILFILTTLTNSRAPFLLALFITGYFLYFSSRKKIRIVFISIYTVITLFLINELLGIFDIYRLPIIDKFIRGYEVGNMTSSRDLIWDNIINGFNNSSIKDKIIGNGFGYSFVINKLNLNLDLWSHNDFYEILLGLGIIGILITVFIYYKLFKTINSFSVTIAYAIVAYWNGMFVYYQSVILLPIFIIAIRTITYKKRRVYEENSILNA